MARIGSDSGLVGNNSGGVFDDSGNPIVTADTEFGASPLGIAARSQALYFLPNPSFNILPPDPSSPIVDNANALPYWSVEDLSEGRIVATTVFDETAQTWALEIDPTAGSATDSIAVKTRSYLLNDSNFDLRQKALASLEKVNAYAGTTQWALTLSAEYFDATNTSLSAFTIGTAADNATWTSLSGFTTSGTAIVNAAAQYVDLTFTLTTTAAVTSTVKVHINSILLQTSTAGGAGGGFYVVEKFTSSTTWNVPSGVTVVDVMAQGGGGGGGGGFRSKQTASSWRAASGAGGGGGAFVWHQGVDITGASSITIGIGAGGTGGTAGGGSSQGTAIGGDGSAGGNSSFGTYVVAGGGGGGVGGVGTNVSSAGGAGGAVTVPSYNFLQSSFNGGAGGRTTQYSGAATATVTVSNQPGFDGGLSGVITLPYYGATNYAAGQAGGSATSGGGATKGNGGAGGVAGAGGGGGAGQTGGSNLSGAGTIEGARAGGVGGGGGGGGVVYGSNQLFMIAGNGGNAGANTGGGGGGGGVAVDVVSAGTAVVQAGTGGDGASGCFVLIAYIA
jgi:hypothetical protein